MDSVHRFQFKTDTGNEKPEEFESMVYKHINESHAAHGSPIGEDWDMSAHRILQHAANRAGFHYSGPRQVEKGVIHHTFTSPRAASLLGLVQHDPFGPASEKTKEYRRQMSAAIDRAGAAQAMEERLGKGTWSIDPSKTDKMDVVRPFDID